MSQLTYNGIFMQYVSTREFKFAEALESSGVDQKYIEVTLTVQFVVTAKDIAGFNPDGSPFSAGETSFFPARFGETPTATIVRLRETLMAPRGHLEFTMGGVSMLDVRGPDQMQGPIPQYCNPVLEHGFGSHPTQQQLNAGAISPAWVIEFSIKCALIDCPAGLVRAFLTLRWSQTVDIDERGYSTLTTSGRATINPAALAVNDPPNNSPDTLREALIPPLIPGFYRAAKYTLSESVLEFDFNIIDKQRLYDPPITIISKEQVVRFVGRADVAYLAGGIGVATITVEITGKRKADKSELVRLGLKIIGQKFEKFDPVGAGKKKSYSATLKVEEEMDDDKVRLVARSHNANIDLRKPGLNLNDADAPNAILIDNITKRVGTPPAAIGQKVLDVGSRGNAMLLLIGAALGDPCIEALPGPTVGLRQGISQSTSVTTIPELLPSLTDQLSAGWDSVVGVWESCVAEVTVDEDSGRSLLPISGSLPTTGLSLGGSLTDLLSGGGPLNPAAFGGADNAGADQSGLTCAVVRLHNPVVTRTFAITVSKVGSAPAIPAFESNQLGVVPMTRRYVASGQDQMADGAIAYTQSLVYTYAYLNAGLAALAYPLFPWQEQTTDNQQSYFDDVVDQGLVDPSFVGAGTKLPEYT